MRRTLELLAPAKNLEVGIAAIDHGADAVYIGADRFGARQAAGNTVEDIRSLCDYAHQYGVTVHVTINTIVYDDELEATFQLMKELEEAGVDALLVQDMGVVDMYRQWKAEKGDLHLVLHASTQCDTRTSEKVKWLHSQGFQRVVLARELSLDEIRTIHEENPEVELEAFVHGALCVSYSGVCYASQYCFQRSANRGACAQFCRLKFDLRDDSGKLIEQQRHLLSLKDMCQIDHLEELADAGASAFKIEGRLKDAGYVKNVVSAYSRKLDEICEKHPEKYCRASRGKVAYGFEPDLRKTFNRGYTTYFLNGRQPDIASFDTPKAMGEYVGKVKEIRRDSFNVAGTASFANGDGLCFINDEHELEGFRVNRASGNRLFPLRMPEHLRPGMGLYRNNDEAFEKLLSGKSAERRLPVTLRFAAVDGGFELSLSGSAEGSATVEFEHQEAKKPQRDNIIRQLSKIGNTIYAVDDIIIEEGADGFFIPSSVLSDLRRRVFEEARSTVDYGFTMGETQDEQPSSWTWQPEYGRYPYLYNISNDKARAFYEREGMKELQRAFEKAPVDEPLVMQCRHCIRYSLGYCVKRGGRKPTWQEPLHLELPDGRHFRLEFKCSECQMNIYAEK